jgi:hypothetical protein
MVALDIDPNYLYRSDCRQNLVACTPHLWLKGAVLVRDSNRGGVWGNLHRGDDFSIGIFRYKNTSRGDYRRYDGPDCGKLNCYRALLTLNFDSELVHGQTIVPTLIILRVEFLRSDNSTYKSNASSNKKISPGASIALSSFPARNEAVQMEATTLSSTRV